MFSDAITILSILITAASIYVALWQYHRAKKLSLQAKSVTWEDFDHATTRYVVRAFLAYTADTGRPVYVYSKPITVSYNDLAG